MEGFSSAGYYIDHYTCKYLHSIRLNMHDLIIKETLQHLWNGTLVIQVNVDSFDANT